MMTEEFITDRHATEEQDIAFKNQYKANMYLAKKGFWVERVEHSYGGWYHCRVRGRITLQEAGKMLITITYQPLPYNNIGNKSKSKKVG